MNVLWSILSYIISTGIGGVLLNFYTKYNQDLTDKKIRAITSGMQINIISNSLDNSAYSTDNSEQTKFSYKELRADLIYLNSWSDYINENLIDYGVMYHNAHNSLHDIDAVLKLLVKEPISYRCTQQIKNYQDAYNKLMWKRSI